jgi:hypothetical protein
MLRTRDPGLRRRLIDAVSLGEWKKLRTEIYHECRDVRKMLETRRPEWMAAEPDLALYYKLKADWSPAGGFWRRVRRAPGAEARLVADEVGLERAREDAKYRRGAMGEIHFDQMRLSGWTGRPIERLPGWDGTDVDWWRLDSQARWWEHLIVHPDQPVLDWLGPFVDVPAIARSFESWNRVWLHEATIDELPREWLRWAVMVLQSMRRVTPGTPADNQIALYAYEADLLLSADKGFVDIINRVGESAPQRLALARVIRTGLDPVQQVDDVVRSFA